MKKIALLLLVITVLGVQANAQKLFMFGPRVGLSSSTLDIKNIDDATFETEGAQLGFHAGVFARISIPLVGIYIQPELLYTSTSGKVNVTEPSTLVSQIRNYDFNRIDLPVMIGFKAGKIFRINAGPSFSYLLSAEENGANILENYRSATVGYQAGLGLDLGPILIDAKYEGNLSKFGDQVKLGNQAFSTDQRLNQFILSLGFRL
ncbi:MAG: PorT family protein [Cyclobacteriaceae bacterium]|nr:PorT family protein [Cyclobacteriaceae bacterium]